MIPYQENWTTVKKRKVLPQSRFPIAIGTGHKGNTQSNTMRIFLTGATGFIGSHIAGYLVTKGHRVVATRRINSKFANCDVFFDSVEWVNTDDASWIEKLVTFKPEIIIHTAWDGVGAGNRDNAEVQQTNIDFMQLLLAIAKKCDVKKFISFGSQAEYGIFAGDATESYPLNPVDNYGKVKLDVLNLFQHFCIHNNIEWYWLRIFSILGTNENPTWLLPQVIKKLRAGEEIELTKGEQRYDYLFVSDFLERLNLVIENETNTSGIYNICSGRGIEIKELIEAVACQLKVSTHLLKFGAIPYRANQNMNIVGCPDKFEMTFGKVALESLETSIGKILEDSD